MAKKPTREEKKVPSAAPSVAESQNGQGGDESPDDPKESLSAESSAAERDVRELVQELDAARNQALRFQADLENYRKRVQREAVEDRKYAALPLLRDLLAVRDNLDRAIQAADNSAAGNATSKEPAGDPSGLLEGVRLVAQQFATIMQQHGCQEIEAQGQPFDPHWHEAISSLPSQEHEAGVVVQVVQSGFRIHERVIRPAHVIVSTGPPQTDE